MSQEGPPVLLIAEDDEAVREELTNLLTGAGYLVHAAAHGAEAIEVLRRGVRPHAIVIDLAMPVMNGWRFWDWIQESSFKNVPVVIFTASGLSQGSFGAPVRVIQKGRNPQDLLDALSSEISKGHAKAPAAT